MVSILNAIADFAIGAIGGFTFTSIVIWAVKRNIK